MKSPVVIETLEVARQDGRGRRLAGGAEREALIAAFAQSGMTQQAFAEREGINRFTLATWLRKKRAEGLRSQPHAAPRFAYVVLSKYAHHLPLYADHGIERPMPGPGLCRVA